MAIVVARSALDLEQHKILQAMLALLFCSNFKTVRVPSIINMDTFSDQDTK